MERVGRYRILRELGAGGQGTVYEAIREGPGPLRISVALKVLDDAAGLVREARIGGLLRHRHLVDVYEVGEASGTWFAAMELCPDGSLASVPRPLPPRAVVEIGLQVCRALQYAHETLGLVHLDLKPANLLRTGALIKVADLGIARAEGFERRRRIEGTPGYMAPEQRLGLDVDARTDVYALGMVLRELSSGAPPSAEVTVALDDPGELAVDAVPTCLSPILDRCLDPDPRGRYPSMAALAEALAAVRAGGASLPTALGVPADGDVAAALGPEPDAFIGRSAELHTLRSWLSDGGVATVKGPGGAGKSRLARRAASAWAEANRAFVLSCDLSEADDLVSAVARELGLRGSDAVAEALAARGPAVVLLDNADPVAHDAPAVIAWAAAAPEARFVLTSRQRLPFPADRVLDLGPLTVQDGVALFSARARIRGVEVGDDPAVPELVARLDGMPLAIELAAGRVGTLAPAEVLDRLGLSLLRTARPGVPERHETMRATVAWSVDQLDADERTALAALSVLRAPFTLASAEAIVAAEPCGPWVVDTVGRLTDRSLLSTRGDRFALSVPVRELAAEHLGDDAPVVAARHRAWFARLGTDAAMIGRRSHGGARLRLELAFEEADLVAACRSAIAAEDHDAAVATLRALMDTLESRGGFPLGLELAERILALGLDAPLPRGRVHEVMATLLRLLGRGAEAASHWEAALAAFREVGEERLAGAVVGNLAILAREDGRLDDAVRLYEAAIASARQAGDLRLEAAQHANLGNVRLDVGRFGDAIACYRRARELAAQAGHASVEAFALRNLGSALLRSGEPAPAVDALLAALGIFRDLGDRRSEALVTGDLATARSILGEHAAALELSTYALDLLRTIGDPRLEALVVLNRGELHWKAGRPPEALRDLDAALALLRSPGQTTVRGHALALKGRALADAGQLPDARAACRDALTALRAGRDQAALARGLCHAAEVALASGGVDEARAAIDEATRLADHAEEAERAPIATAIAAAREHLARTPQHG